VSGILVLDARKGGPAYKSGIKGTSRDEYGRLVIGDVITAFKGVPIKYGCCAIPASLTEHSPQLI
jgi:S1-C subfamily serine protease